MKRRNLERHLRSYGVRLLREGGIHGFWGIDAERSTAVPGHREIDIVLARKICADLGIPLRAGLADRPPRSHGLAITQASYDTRRMCANAGPDTAFSRASRLPLPDGRPAPTEG